MYLIAQLSIQIEDLVVKLSRYDNREHGLIDASVYRSVTVLVFDIARLSIC
jgi:hypothetical protein